MPKSVREPSPTKHAGATARNGGTSMIQPAKRSIARRWLTTPMAVVVLGATLLIPATSVSAADPTDMVLEWNVNAINAIGNANGATPPGPKSGEWRPIPPLNANVFSWVGDVRPFALDRTSRLRTEGPPALDSAQYAIEFNEVKAIGAQTGSTRTAAQNELANFIVANPVVLTHRMFRELAVSKHLSTAEQARLFAMGTMSTADAFIACWDNKNFHHFWRPQTAIREADDDGNPATDPDAGWLSLFPTPGYPDSPSGYNCIAAAMM